jgi:hypothetical protein
VWRSYATSRTVGADSSKTMHVWVCVLVARACVLCVWGCIGGARVVCVCVRVRVRAIAGSQRPTRCRFARHRRRRRRRSAPTPPPKRRAQQHLHIFAAPPPTKQELRLGVERLQLRPTSTEILTQSAALFRFSVSFHTAACPPAGRPGVKCPP